jgi:hypothetical protein
MRIKVISAICALGAVMPNIAFALPVSNFITPPQNPADVNVTLFKTGNNLVELCEASGDACRTYIEGVMDGQVATITFTSRTVAYKIPTSATIGELQTLVVKYLNDHPEQRHLQAGWLIAKALVAAYPRY